MEEVLEETEVTKTRWIRSNRSVAVLYKPAGSGCKGLEMDVSDSEVGDMLVILHRGRGRVLRLSDLGELSAFR